MLNILEVIILIIIFFIIILLATGIKIIFRYNKTGSEVKGCLKILIFKKIKIYSLDLPFDNKENKDKDFKEIVKLAKPCSKDLLNYLKLILKTVDIKKIENHIVFGLESYAETGKYIGIIWGVLAVINSANKNLKISAEPSFRGSVFDMKGENEFEFYPFKILMPTIRLISKKEIRLLIRSVLNG